jgi:hypothetical protein
MCPLQRFVKHLVCQIYARSYNREAVLYTQMHLAYKNYFLLSFGPGNRSHPMRFRGHLWNTNSDTLKQLTCHHISNNDPYLNDLLCMSLLSFQNVPIRG